MLILWIIFSLIAFWVLAPSGYTPFSGLMLYVAASVLIGWAAAALVAIPIRMMLRIKQRDYPNDGPP